MLIFYFPSVMTDRRRAKFEKKWQIAMLLSSFEKINVFVT